jgi:thymidylate synthase|tara:strand:+ start:8213 stop:8467 length:255 start_codon:yes stop_codon:yes gene_type:complete
MLKRNHERILEEKRIYYHEQIANALEIVRQMSSEALSAIEKYDKREWGGKRTINYIKEQINRSLSITNSLFQGGDSSNKDSDEV